MAMTVTSASKDAQKLSVSQRVGMNKINNRGISCFPDVNGVVHVECREFQGDLRVIEGAYIYSAVYRNGRYQHELVGQRYEHIVKNIWVDAHTQEKIDARALTCIFLEELQEGFERGESYIDTVFGLKYVEWPRQKKEVTSSEDWVEFRRERATQRAKRIEQTQD